MNEIKDNNPTAEVIILTPKQKKSFMASWNASPPVSSESYDDIAYAYLPEMPDSALIMFVNSMCVVRAFPAPMQGIRDFIKDISHKSGFSI